MVEIACIDDLSFSYGNNLILNSANFTINKGDFIAIIGSNGAGKSTLLKLLLNELNPNSGSIKWFDENIKSFKGWDSIGYVPQNNILADNNFPATVEEIIGANLFSSIGFLKLPTNKHKNKILEALKLVSMESYSKSLIKNLSGGQQQKIMLAMALVNNPQVLILDEPTSGVDFESSLNLYQLLHDLNITKGITIIMVTHNIESVCKYLNRAFYLDKKTFLELPQEEILLFNPDSITCKHILPFIYR